MKTPIRLSMVREPRGLRVDDRSLHALEMSIPSSLPQSDHGSAGDALVCSVINCERILGKGVVTATRNPRCCCIAPPLSKRGAPVASPAGGAVTVHQSFSVIIGKRSDLVGHGTLGFEETDSDPHACAAPAAFDANASVPGQCPPKAVKHCKFMAAAIRLRVQRWLGCHARSSPYSPTSCPRATTHFDRRRDPLFCSIELERPGAGSRRSLGVASAGEPALGGISWQRRWNEYGGRGWGR